MARLDDRLPSREMEEDIQIMCPEAAVSLELGIGTRETDPLQCAADARFQSNLYGVAAEVHRSIEPATSHQDLGVPETRSRDPLKITYRKHVSLFPHSYRTRASHGRWYSVGPQTTLSVPSRLNVKS